jgi:uncharacterized protein
MADFTPLASLAGGAMIGLAAVLLLLVEGRIAGISGIAARLLPPVEKNGWPGRFAFLAGLTIAPVAIAWMTGERAMVFLPQGPVLLAIAGLLVGFGAVLGNGCTSGHGVCGLSRLSVRALFATLTFMSTAAATVFFVRHLL